MGKDTMGRRMMTTIVILLFIIILSCGCLDEKSKFIGTWQYSEGGTMTFNNDNTVVINNIGPLGNLELTGVFDYNIANNQITFSSGSIGVTLNYSFPDSNTLIVSNDAGLSINLVKQ
jgi:hypothetical protein